MTLEELRLEGLWCAHLEAEHTKAARDTLPTTETVLLAGGLRRTLRSLFPGGLPRPAALGGAQSETGRPVEQSGRAPTQWGATGRECSVDSVPTAESRPQGRRHGVRGSSCGQRPCGTDIPGAGLPGVNPWACCWPAGGRGQTLRCPMPRFPHSKVDLGKESSELYLFGN